MVKELNLIYLTVYQKVLAQLILIYAFSDGGLTCPFGGFHYCPDGEVDNKGIARLISHLKRLHLPSDERKCVLREAISMDHGLYIAVEDTLKAFGQWLCGKCMDLHAVSLACHHPDGHVRFSKGSDDMSGYNVGISTPSNKEPEAEVTDGLVLDVELLDRVFKVLISSVKCIPHGCRLTFSQALKIVLCKVCKLKNRQECMSGNRKSLQQSPILWSLATWGKDDGITTILPFLLSYFPGSIMVK
nr:reverse transcriptase domain-containing protein [Tanacetum cinerariifolium]